MYVIFQHNCFEAPVSVIAVLDVNRRVADSFTRAMNPPSNSQQHSRYYCYSIQEIPEGWKACFMQSQLKQELDCFFKENAALAAPLPAVEEQPTLLSYLDAHGIVYSLHNEETQINVKTGGGIVSFWPSTGVWVCLRAKIRGRGENEFLAFIMNN